MKNSIVISDSLSLPIDAVTQKFGILGRTGSGKTYAANKLAEEMLGNQSQIVALDPVGVWYGLRVGTSFEIPIFGGLHGDMPLEPGAGEFMANLIVDRGISAVLDVSQFLSHEQSRFAYDFATRFFFRKKSSPSAVHLFIEECQEFVPQNVMGGSGGFESKMLHAFERLIKLGRNFGIGASLISQRPQEVNKKALNQTECLLAFQMTGPQERKAVASWVADKAGSQGVIDILPKLKVGQCHIWSPQWLQVDETIKISKKKSSDVSSTPKAGDVKRIETKPLSQSEIEKLSAEMLDTIERAKADDPKQLRKQIAELKRSSNREVFEREITELKKQVANTTEKTVPAVKDAQISKIERCLAKSDKIIERLRGAQVELSTVVEPVRDALLKLTAKAFKSVYVPPQPSQVPHPIREVVARGQSSNGSLSKCERSILIALAQYPQGRDATRVAILTRYSVNSGGFNNALSKLRTAGFITRSQPIQITDLGLSALGDNWEPLPTGQGLLHYWYDKLGKCERSILETLASNYPNPLTSEHIAERTGYSSNSGGFNNSLSRLRTLELIGRGQPIAISEEFFNA